jgi:hypothetical protein
MSEERDKFVTDPDEGEDVEGHKYRTEEEKHERYGESSEDGDDEVEAHKF